MLTLVFPIPLGEIPFIKESEETWLYNFYPSYYISVLNAMIESYMLYISYEAFVN